MHCVGSPVRKSCWEEDNPSKEIPNEPCFVQLDVTALCGCTYLKCFSLLFLGCIMQEPDVCKILL